MWSALRSKKAKWFFGVLFVVKLVCLCLALSVAFRGGDHADNYATCESCHCIPEAGEPCPFDRMSSTGAATSVTSNTTSRARLVQNLRAIRHVNPLILTCDPYRNESCETNPKQDREAGACVVEYEFRDVDACPVSYRLRTYDGSIHDAREAGLLVTHAGTCGVCSSLQDLAAYMEQGAALRHSATLCGIRGRVSASDGVQCFREIGFTESCAQMWFYNTRNTAQHCMRQCVTALALHSPANQNLPGCPLDACIECDEVNSGPLFKQFAGRSRRNSGLRSSIVRRCSDMESLEVHDPCDQITSPTSTLQPTESQYKEIRHYLDEQKVPHVLKVAPAFLRTTDIRH